MNIRNSKRLIKHIYKKSRDGKYVPLMFHGATGVGKTSIIDEVGLELREELGLPDFRVINYRLSQKEQGDLVGLPYDMELVPCPYCLENGHNHDQKSETILHQKRKLMEHIYKYHNGDFKKNQPTYEDAMNTIRMKYSHLIQIRTAFSIPIDLPTSGHGILHLDELNRAMKPVRDAAFELVWERKLSKYKLPDGWIIICSVNPPTSEKYIVHELDGAMVARFCHIRFCPEVEEWNQFAAKKGLDETVRRFVYEYPHFLGNEMLSLSHEPVYCPRTMEMLANIKDGLDEDLVYEVAAGCLGTEAATAYMSLLNSKERPIPADKILNEYEEIKNKVKDYANIKNNRADLLRVSIDDLILLLSKIEEDLSEKQLRNLHKFIENIPKDLGVGLLKLMIHSESNDVQDHFRQLAADKEFREFLRKEYKNIGMERL
jgi:DNA polymerase III delta prime subunit